MRSYHSSSTYTAGEALGGGRAHEDIAPRWLVSQRTDNIYYVSLFVSSATERDEEAY